MGRMLPKGLLFVLLITGSCAALAYVVTLVTNISPANAYLPTTPGGINAVLALASSVDANVALVFAVQTLRLFAMVLLAPVALRWWLSRHPATATPTPPEQAGPTRRTPSPNSRTRPPTDRLRMEGQDCATRG